MANVTIKHAMQIHMGNQQTNQHEPVIQLNTPNTPDALDEYKYTGFKEFDEYKQSIPIYTNEIELYEGDDVTYQRDPINNRPWTIIEIDDHNITIMVCGRSHLS